MQPGLMAAAPAGRIPFTDPSMAARYDYGGVPEPVKPASAFTRSRRRTINLLAICQNIFGPWALFCVLFAIWSFSVHYEHPSYCYLFAGLGLLPVLAIGASAGRAQKQQLEGRGGQPSWVYFLFLTTGAAWLAAIAAGDCNYYLHMQPFYDLENLNTYPAVDPSVTSGQQLMDAGRINFVDGTELDLRRSMGFKNEDLYCVAPITKGTAVLSSYDYWAVGMNCCTGNTADFHCPEFSNAHARAGLRLMHDDQRAFYRLAVQEAEATYNIKAAHPLFFYWMQDPNEQMNAYREAGLRFYLLGMLTHFVLNLVCVVVAVIAFSKIGYY